MICTCLFCHRPFWRFRRDWPPRGYCSWPCSLTPAAIIEVPRLPQDVLLKLRLHHKLDHNENSILCWPDCETCEQIEQEYAAALSFHYQQQQVALHTAANQREATSS